MAWIILTWIRQRTTAFDFRSLPVRLDCFVVLFTFFLLSLFPPLFLLLNSSYSKTHRERKRIFIEISFNFLDFDISTYTINFYTFITGSSRNPKFLGTRSLVANSSHQLPMQISNDEERIELRNPTSTRSTFSKAPFVIQRRGLCNRIPSFLQPSKPTLYIEGKINRWIFPSGINLTIDFSNSFLHT